MTTTPCSNARRRVRSTSRRGWSGFWDVWDAPSTEPRSRLLRVLRKARFWEKHAQATINDRQRVILNRLLDGFTGNLTTTKWATLVKSSHDTALRDIQDLIDQGDAEERFRRADAARAIRSQRIDFLPPCGPPNQPREMFCGLSPAGHPSRSWFLACKALEISYLQS